jgi:Ca2+-dependent lipid-binding protein
VPPWARADAGGYQQEQQSWGGNGASPMESLGFASQNASLGQSLNNDDVLKKAILAIVMVIIVALASLVLLGVLAAFIPGLRWLFLLAIVLVFLVPWIVYNTIRRRIRRTIGRIGWFF